MNMLTKIKKNKIVLFGFRTVFNALTFLPKKNDLIIFESFNGRQFSDNPRAIYEYMQQHHPEYRMVWSVDKRHKLKFSEYELDCAVKFSLKWLFLLPQAKYWVTNSRFPLWFRKSKDTVYLQTWHGTPLKKLGTDIEAVKMPGTETNEYHQNFLKEAKKWDYLVSPNKYSSDIFKKAFGFQKEMLESGYPRNDVLVTMNHRQAIEELKVKAKLPLNKKVILYAPTWRDDQHHDIGSYKFDIRLDLAQLKESLGEDHILLLRYHYLVAENINLNGYEGFAYDFSSYSDIRDLYLMSDVLITDYSSVFFDYSILKKPVLFYVYDIENYRDHLRGFYFDLESDSPGPLLRTSEEVVGELLLLQKEGYQATEKLMSFHDRFAYLEDGKASERVVQEVFKTEQRS